MNVEVNVEKVLLALSNEAMNLPEKDKDDLKELIPYIFDEDEEQRTTAIEAIQEILAQEKPEFIELELNEPPSEALQRYMNHLGDKIIKERLKQNLTEHQLADRSELPLAYIYGIEAGAKSPSSLALEKIATALDFNVDDFMEIPLLWNGQRWGVE